MRITIGVDPGKTGAIATYIPIKDLILTQMPKNVYDLRDYIASIKLMANEHDEIEAFLENVHAMPGQGVTSMFTFGRGFGQIEAVFACLNIPFTLVTPQKWQKHFSLPKRKDFASKTTWKARLREAALNRWPLAKIGREDGDAVLILTYGLDSRTPSI